MYTKVDHDGKCTLTGVNFHFHPFVSSPDVRTFKVSGHAKFKFVVGFPHQYNTFYVIKHVPFIARVSGNLDLKFHNLSPFCIFSIDFRIFNLKGDKLRNVKSK